ncbi:MAG: hypothetical protein KatS3mg124_1796 [Porticoccaceae bacterium]|nr:MAG: hypothetical protein KatS3mg124_1796 [Porticoccaceae bacterium]
MPETLFAFDQRNYRDCQRAYRGPGEREYYLGDYTIEGGAVVDVRAERKGVGSYSLIRLRSRSRLNFTRSWSHIREDATDVVVLWFVRRGRLAVTHPGGEVSAAAGEFALTQSLSPFTIQCLPDVEGQFEVFHLVAPSHRFRRHLEREPRPALALPAEVRELSLAERILADVFEADGLLPADLEASLVEDALAVVAAALARREECLRVRRSLPEQRLAEVLRYIDLHLSDPSLSAAAVARACGISPRYLSFLLKRHGSRFSDLVWEKRLSVAAHWLATSAPSEISIAEVAFRVGFKSPAHFSRMFKRVFRKGPRQYRAEAQVSRGAARPRGTARAPVNEEDAP